MIVDACEGSALAPAKFGCLHLPSTGSGFNTHFYVDLEQILLCIDHLTQQHRVFDFNTYWIVMIGRRSTLSRRLQQS
jgi:hypothetical protein